MFGKKKPENLTCEERKQIAKLIVESDFVMTSVSEAIQDTIEDHRMKYWIEDQIKEQFNEPVLKGKVHSVMNSDPMTEIIYEHLKDKRKANKFLKLMLKTDTPEGVPELYFSNSKKYNENTPLGWSESLFIVALHDINKKILK